MQAYKTLDFCKSIDCDLLETAISSTKKGFCSLCRAYKMHQYLRDHNQILEEGYYLSARIGRLETELAHEKLL
jgi:hypothetical protein